MTRADGERVVAGQLERGVVIAGPAHQPLAGSLAEGQAETDAGHRADQRFVEVFHGLDEVRLAEDEVGGFRLDDGDYREFHSRAPASRAMPSMVGRRDAIASRGGVRLICA